MNVPFYIRLLGAPELTWQSRPYSVPRRQTRALLYRLAAEMEPISRDRLLLLFWPAKPEVIARRNLTRLVSSLRRALPHSDLLLSDISTVSLNTQLAVSDAVVFFQLSDQENELAWEQAVALVRSPFLDGFALSSSPDFDLWQTGIQQRVERRYLRTLAKLIASKTESGDLATAIHYANQYLATDDLAETVHHQLITLYAGIGEREAAMRQFEACSLVLERELGIGPLPETRAAFEGAKRGEPNWGESILKKIGRPQWQTLPSLDLPLIGRKKEQSQLEAALTKLDSGGCVFISGEPGIGKSRLMQEIASAQDATILLGHCQKATQLLPYLPLVEALRGALAHPNFGEGVRPIWLAETVRLLPELNDSFPNLPRTVDAPTPQAQARQFEALWQVFLSLATQGSLLVCVDDLHWADETTLSWLQFIVPRLRNSGLVLLATYRSEEAKSLAALQQTLRRTGYIVDVWLGALAEDAVVDIIDKVSAGKSPPDLPGRIHRMAGGNTFFVLETARDLLEQNLLENPPNPLPVPASVLEMVQWRVARLNPVPQQLLDASAVLATNLSFEAIQVTTGRSDLEMSDGLDELVRRQLLKTKGDGFDFQHDLIKAAVYQKLMPWRRCLLNRRAGDALEKVFRQKLDTVAAQIARHYDEAGQSSSAIRYYQHAASYAQGIYANHEAVQYYERALTLLKNETSDEWLDLQIRLYEGLGQVLRRQAHYERAEQAYQSMQAAAAKLGDPELLAQTWLRLGQVQDSLKRYSDSFESAANAKMLAAKYGLDATHALALYAQAWALFRLDKLEEALHIAQEAVSQSIHLNHREAMALSQNALGAIYKYLGHYQLSEQHQQQALELFEQLGDTRRVAGVLNNLGETARLRQDYAQAYDFYQRAVTIAGQIGERDWLVEFLSNLGFAQNRLGKYREAELSFCQAIEAAEAANLQINVNLYVPLAEAYLAQGKWLDALAAGTKALQLVNESTQRVVAGDAWLVLGRIAEKAEAPISIGATQYDAATCLTECRRIFMAAGEAEKAVEVTRLLSELKVKK